MKNLHSDVTWRPVTEDGQLPPNNMIVLAVLQDGERKTVVRTRFVRQYTVRCAVVNCEGDDADYNEDEDDYYWPEGWYEWNEYEPWHWRLSGNITHWAPLPGLPEERMLVERIVQTLS